MLDVKGKWALITGASRGLGYKAALFMAEKGCNLVLHSRKLSHNEKIVNAVKAVGVECFSVEADLTNSAEVVSMLDEIESKKIDVDIVLNNAAVQGSYRQDYTKAPADEFETLFKVNVIAPTVIMYRMIPKMQKKGFGRIVNTTSGIENMPELGAYSASKAALDKLTKDIAAKLNGTNVMVNLADPGWCKTDLGGSNAPNAPESAIPGIVLGVFLDEKKSGRIINAQDFKGMTIENAVKKFENK